MNNNNKLMEWVLRLAVFGEFLGHGVFALGQKKSWLVYFGAVGILPDTAMTLMPLIGIFDIALAVLILIRPVPIALLWMSLWGFMTALVRPLAGEPIWDFVERWANWGAPLALFLLRGFPRGAGEWFGGKRSNN